jgi:ABC-type glycerol-3-phosphate transport system substrate-binding protein
MSARVRLFALALVACLALAACGGSGSSGGGDDQQIRAVVGHLRDSDEAVCGEMTAKFLKQVFKDKAACEKQAKAAKQTNTFKIQSVKVSGDKATATIGAKQQKGTVTLVKEGGDWKISGVKSG